MAAKPFKKDEMAKFYAGRHLKTDPGIKVIHYLPAHSPEREIRLVEINELMVEREKDPLEPIDFGVNMDGADAHRLMVLDVTPAQWERIEGKELPLPDGWVFEDSIPFSR